MAHNPIDVKLDLTDVANKIYDDVAHKPLKCVGDAVGTVVDFFNNTVLYPMQKYNLYAKNKLEEYANELKDKAKEIPLENLVYPRVNILGPTIEALKYNLNEEYIKELFTNILVSDMDDRKQSKVLPAYIELVKQLSQNDAKMLKYFNENNIKNGPIFKIKYLNEDGGFIYPNNNIILINKDNNDVLESIIIDNLSRLKLIEISFSEYRNDSTIYDKAFKEISFFKDINLLPPNIELGYSKGLLKITSFGQNFIDVCLS